MTRKERNKAKKKLKKEKNYEYINKLREGEKCRKCKVKHGSAAWLEFHHLNSATKRRTVSRGIQVGWSLKTIKEEIVKCILLCRDCHVGIHQFLLDIQKGA